MSLSFDHLAIGLLITWLVYRTVRGFVSGPTALALGGGLAALLLVFGQPPMSMLVAVLAPMGFMIPALIGRDIAAGFGAPVTPLGVWDVGLALVVCTALTLATLGFLHVDLYRLGYLPFSGSLIALLAIAYCLFRRHFWLAAVLLAGQAVWVADIGSTNLFDYIGHLLIIPAALGWLTKSAIASLQDRLRAQPTG